MLLIFGAATGYAAEQWHGLAVGVALVSGGELVLLLIEAIKDW